MIRYHHRFDAKENEGDGNGHGHVLGHDHVGCDHSGGHDNVVVVMVVTVIIVHYRAF